MRKIILFSYIEKKSVDCFLVSPGVNDLGYYTLKNNYGLTWIRTFFCDNYKICEYESKNNKKLFLASVI